MIAARRLLAALLLAVAPTPLAAAQSDEADVVAIVDGEEILREHLKVNPRVEAVNRERIASDEAFAQWKENQKAQILRIMVFRELRKRYVQENGITVSEGEIQAFFDREKIAYDNALVQLEANHAALVRQYDILLAENKPIPAELERDVKVAENKIKNHKRRDLRRVYHSTEQARFVDELEHRRATGNLETLKFNKLMHEQYGGKVLRSGLTYEPYEAFDTWLQVEEKLGTFTIVDEQIAEGFWSFYADADESAVEPFPGMWDSLRWSDTDMP